MNTGIQDAIVLGHAMARVPTGSPESLLDEYERVRRPVAERVVTLTDRMTRAATLRSRIACSLRNALLGVAGRIPAAQRWIALELAELKYR
jgi:2-polyprenyl-6-methoxyphenol hydroxylase-like FAD-dependent oxidoreductase